MIYYKDNEILIRNMEPADAQIITDEEIALGWQATTKKYEMRLQHTQISFIWESDYIVDMEVHKECM